MSIRVLVVSSYDDAYNAVRPEGELIIGLHQAGVDIKVMTQGHAPYAQRFRENGVPIIDYHPSKKYDPKAIELIRKELTEGDRQILHLFNNPAITNGLLAAWNLPVKVVTYRGYAGNIDWWNPLCYLTHLNPRVDKITCLSDAIREVFHQQLFFPKHKAVTVHKGHDPAWYEDVPTGDLSEFGFPPDAIVASIVANARRMKGIPYLVEAMGLLPREPAIYFLFMGRGLDDKHVLDTLERNGWRDRVVFAGFRRDVLSLVKACDFSILPSVKGESLTKALLEAFMLGKASVMTDIPGNEGVAVDGETALIVPARSAPPLAEAITRLAKDPDLRERLGRNARAYIGEHFSTARSVREMKEVYRKLVEE